MEVTIETMTGVVVGTRREVDLPLYRIRVDGIHVGTVGIEPGSSIGLTRRFTPEQQHEIQREVDRLTRSKSCSLLQPPFVPDEVRQKLSNEADEGITADDIDA